MSDKYKYGKFDKFIHWLMALNILFTLVFSYGMSELPEAQKMTEYGDHGQSVTTILLCLIIRIVWRFNKGFADYPETMPDYQKLMAKAVHLAIYAVLATQLMSGILLASTTTTDFIATGYGINYTQFALIDKKHYELMLTIHIAGFWTIVSLLLVHVAAALKHHFIDKDDVLRNMLPFVKSH